MIARTLDPKDTSYLNRLLTAEGHLTEAGRLFVRMSKFLTAPCQLRVAWVLAQALQELTTNEVTKRAKVSRHMQAAL